MWERSLNSQSTTQQILDERTEYSSHQIQRLSDRLSTLQSATAISGLTAFCAGSYGRLEASEHSDIDLFFVNREPENTLRPRTSGIRLFADTIKVIEDLQIPELTDDGRYLTIHELPSVLAHLGAPADDFNNHFTMRMLMLLEGRVIHGQANFENTIKDFVESYYRDYPYHSQDFQPTFLINDISRFWKTLLLNYEHRRNQKSDDTAKLRAKGKNFKLKFSRMTICYATILSIASFNRQVTPDDICSIVELTPMDRLRGISERVSQYAPSERSQRIASLVDELVSDYAWFLEETSIASDDFLAKFRLSESKEHLFGRASGYREKMLRLLDEIDDIEDAVYKVRPVLLI